MKMDGLKHTIKQVISVDYSHMQDFIAKTYNIDSFSILESPNDTTHEYDVDGKVDKWDRDTLKDAIEGEGIEHYSLGVVLNDLAAKELILTGTYLVRVCW